MLPNFEYDIRLAVNELLVGWLYNSMSPEIVAQVMGHDEAKALWDAIREYYWCEAFHTVVYLINRMPSIVIKGKTH